MSRSLIALSTAVSDLFTARTARPVVDESTEGAVTVTGAHGRARRPAAGFRMTRSSTPGARAARMMRRPAAESRRGSQRARARSRAHPRCAAPPSCTRARVSVRETARAQAAASGGPSHHPRDASLEEPESQVVCAPKRRVAQSTAQATHAYPPRRHIHPRPRAGSV